MQTDPQAAFEPDLAEATKVLETWAGIFAETGVDLRARQAQKLAIAIRVVTAASAALAARVGELEKALEPFAALVGYGPEDIWPDDRDHWSATGFSWTERIKVGDFRRAAQALRREKP